MLEEGASPEEQELIKWTAISLDTGGIDTVSKRSLRLRFPFCN